MGQVELHRFYGDFNCPFCFVQNERLIASGGVHLVEWRGVVHMGWLQQPMRPDPKDTTLTDELRSIGERAPDVTIPAHDKRPHTELATRAVAEVYARDVREGRRLKDAIYQAFWLDRSDISRTAVIADLCERLSVEAPSYGQAHVFTTRRWQKEWEDGPYERRLPALHSRDGALSLGLATMEQLSAFIWTHADQRNEKDSC